MSEMFKPGITDKELNNMRRGKEARAIIDATKNIVEQNQFNVGDVLVLRRRIYGSLIMMAGDMPQKFIVVHKDDANIIYCKRILMSGKIGQGVELPCTYDHDNYEFQLDADLAEHMILDAVDQYDPLAQAKEFRKFRNRVNRFNDKIKVKITRNNFQEVNAFLQQLTPGTIFWSMSSNSDTKPTKYTVITNTQVPVDTAVQRYSQRSQDYDIIQAGFSTKPVVEAKTASGKIDKIGMGDCYWRNFFLQEPKTHNMNEP